MATRFFVDENVDHEPPIEAKLRETAPILPDEVYLWLHPLLIKAADEIESLRRELDDLQNAWTYYEEEY